MVPLQALLFDVDGTLADTEETHRQAFNLAFLRFGLGWEWSEREYARLLAVSGGKERLVAYIGELDVAPAEKSRLQRRVPALHRTKTQAYEELIADGRAPLRPGVARLIGEAQASGLRLAIATTTSAANIEALLAGKLGGGSRRFDVIACADQVASKKPAPDIYRLALARLRLPATACVAFEDSRNGLLAARGAGLCTVVTPTRWTVEQAFSEANLLLRDLGDPGYPLDAADAAAAGAAWLGIEQLRRLHAAAHEPAAG
jgi:HAD superfamily hydrolase (TIGR01509 family)